MKVVYLHLVMCALFFSLNQATKKSQRVLQKNSYHMSAKNNIIHLFLPGGAI